MTVAVDARELKKHFADVRAVDGLSFSVEPGEIYGLVGPDGAGKTTTMRLLCGGFRPDHGHVSIYGYDVIKQPDQAHTQIGYLAQRFSLYGDLTVLENLRFFAEVHGIPTSDWKPRTQEILKFVGLDEFSHRRAEQLSGGMKQKLGLATALVHRPKVLLLDEPTGGVDPVTRQDFWQLIIRLVGQEGVSVVVSTPYMDEASRCTHVGFMNHGQLITEGTPGQVTTYLVGRVLELVGEPIDKMRHVAAADADVEDVQVFGDRLHLRVKAARAESVIGRLPAALAAQGVTVSRIRSISPTLEDVFIELVEKAEANG
ncbi:MAG: ABC transporter ATP-binding protein [Thermoflexales bacterium]|nr:ABC transporter ATP-binding protein [Thermoflexales bacterium]